MGKPPKGEILISIPEIFFTLGVRILKLRLPAFFLKGEVSNLDNPFKYLNFHRYFPEGLSSLNGGTIFRIEE